MKNQKFRRRMLLRHEVLGRGVVKSTTPYSVSIEFENLGLREFHTGLVADKIKIIKPPRTRVRAKPAPVYRAWLPDEVPRFFMYILKSCDLPGKTSVYDSQYTPPSVRTAQYYFNNCDRIHEDGSRTPCGIAVKP